MSETEPRSKKLKVSAPEPFTTQSDPDDIHLKFDDGTILYAHPIFLSLISPVFKSWFQHECLEKTTKTVDLPGKKSEDFLEFLMCLHPAYQRSVDDTNALRIVGIAHEYQVQSIELKCETAMMNMLSKSTPNMNLPWYSEFNLEKVITCLDILEISITLNTENVKKNAIQIVARFGFAMYIKETYGFVSKFKRPPSDCKLLSVCRNRFDKLPDSYKVAILLQRLRYTDDNELVASSEHPLFMGALEIGSFKYKI